MNSALVAAAKRCIRFAALIVERIGQLLILSTLEWRENLTDPSARCCGEIAGTVDKTKVGNAVTVSANTAGENRSRSADMRPKSYFSLVALC